MAETVFKVVRLIQGATEDEYESAIVGGELGRAYGMGEETRACPRAAELGYHLLAFEDYDSASDFAWNNCSARRLCILECEAELVSLPSRVSGVLHMAFDHFIRWVKRGISSGLDWPDGTVMCKWVKPTRRVGTVYQSRWR